MTPGAFNRTPWIFIALCLSLGLVGLVSGNSAAGTPVVGDLSDAPDCAGPGARLTALSNLHRDGTKTPLNITSLAGAIADRKKDKVSGRIFQFESPGTVFDQVLPPAGFVPAEATDAELATFGLPARPVAGSEREVWDRDYAHMDAADPGVVCPSNRVAGGVVGTVNSQNWGGGFTLNGSATLNTYWNAQVRWGQPYFVGVCPGTSAHAIWAGLGGWNSPRLIQAGTDVSASNMNGSYFFWEMLNASISPPEQIMSSPMVAAGNYVGATSTYGSGEVQFDVWNYTNQQYAVIRVSQFAGYPASSFYDGTTADFISERPYGGSASGGWFYLRKPSSGTISFPYALANNQAISVFNSWRINTFSSGHYLQASTYDGVNAWNNNWAACS